MNLEEDLFSDRMLFILIDLTKESQDEYLHDYIGDLLGEEEKNDD